MKKFILIVLILFWIPALSYDAITLKNIKPKYPMKMPLKTIFELNGIDFDGKKVI